MRKMLLHVIQGVLFSIWLLPTTPPPTVAASAPTLTARAKMPKPIASLRSKKVNF